MSDELYVMDQAFRDEMSAHYEAIARLLVRKRLFRGGWRVEVDGCVYKFKAEGYPKRGTPIWQEVEQEKDAAMAEFIAEHGKGSEFV